MLECTGDGSKDGGSSDTDDYNGGTYDVAYRRRGDQVE